VQSMEDMKTGHEPMKGNLLRNVLSLHMRSVQISSEWVWFLHEASFHDLVQYVLLVLLLWDWELVLVQEHMNPENPEYTPALASLAFPASSSTLSSASEDHLDLPSP